MKQMNIQYAVHYKVNETQWECEYFHTLELAKEFAERTNGILTMASKRGNVQW